VVVESSVPQARGEGSAVRWALVLGAVALVVAAIALAVALTRDNGTTSSTAPVPRAWTGAGSGSRHVTSPTTADFQGTMRSDPIGNGTFRSSVTLHGTEFTGTTTITTSDGSVLQGSVAGWDVPTGSTTETSSFTFRIDSGSGRFANASGNANYSATIVTAPGSGSTLTFSFGGLISY
jgi:hypothetical protein